MGEGYPLKEFHAFGKTHPCYGGIEHAPGVVASAPYEQKVGVLWQRRKTFYRLQLVFTRFERPHTYYIWAVESIQTPCFGYGGVVGAMPENRVTSLIHHVDFLRVNAVVGRNVGFGLLRYGDYACGVKAGTAEFVVVYAAVYGAVVFWKMAENQVVDCYNRGDSGSTDVERQFARETVIQRQSVGFKPVCYACLLYTSPSPRDGLLSRMPSSA